MYMEKFRASATFEKPKHTIETSKQLKAALFGAFLSTLSAHHAEAMDFPDNANWQAGVGAMQDAALHEKNERAGIYIRTAGGEGGWHNSHSGGYDSVHSAPVEDSIAIVDEILKDPTAKHATVCIAHSHPNEAGNGYMYGPSTADLKLDVDFTRFVHEDLLKDSSTSVSVEGIVFEKHGVWYYAPSGDATTTTSITQHESTTQGAQKHFTDSLEQTKRTHHDLTMSTLGFQLAMARQGIKSRFVTYEDFFAEPPCAGVDYKKQ